MQFNRSLCAITFLIALGQIAPRVSLALEPLPQDRIRFEVKLENFLGQIDIENAEKEELLVTLVPTSRSSIRGFREISVKVEPGQHQVVKFEFGLDRSQPLHVLQFDSYVQHPDKNTRKGPIFYQTYRFDPTGGAPKPVAFEEFLKNRVEIVKEGQKSQNARIALGAGYVLSEPISKFAFKPHEMSAEDARLIQPVHIESPLALAAKFPLRHLPEISRKSGRPTDESSSEFAEEAENPPEIENMTGFPLNPLEPAKSGVQIESSLTVRGHMSTKYNDGTFHASWGWVVTAWQYQTILGVQFYLPLGWTYVNGDASWSIPLSNLARSDLPVIVQYQTANRFVTLQDPSGNAYTWGDWWPLHGSDTDIGYRFADLSANGDLPGIDRLYEGATELWSRFYYRGLNALRDSPIQVTYPNSLASGHCIQTKDSNGNTVPKYAWSCSQWADGKIWIIPAHGDPSVVEHECAHSINSYYWNGNLSSGAGGAHSLDGCYNGGLALTEGFADFIAYWVQFDRSNPAPSASYFGRNIETYNNDNNCSSGNINEMRVASTFWDMYDIPNDGPDSTRYDGWYYIDPASPVSIYLGNGTHNSMTEYLSIVDAGDSAWFAADRALFRLNRIIN